MSIPPGLATRGVLADPFATGALALLALGALLLMIGGGSEVLALIAIGALVLGSGAALAVVYLRQALAAAPAGGRAVRGHRVAAWAALVVAVATCAVTPLIFWTDAGWAVLTATPICAAGFLSVPVALGARRRASRAGDAGGRCLAGLAVGASLISVGVLALLAMSAIGLASNAT